MIAALQVANNPNIDILVMVRGAGSILKRSD
jgi:exonuclease VII large subunit